jgi:hypothetical protein
MGRPDSGIGIRSSPKQLSTLKTAPGKNGEAGFGGYPTGGFHACRFMTPSLSDLQAVASLATSIGAVFAGSQLWFVRQQGKTGFEDQLTEQYRAIIHGLPIEALLGDHLDDHQIEESLPAFFRYFDLCNEQAYMKKRRRVRAKTWAEWSEGIGQNMKRPAFARAWSIIAERAYPSFGELRTLFPPEPVMRELQHSIRYSVWTFE